MNYPCGFDTLFAIYNLFVNINGRRVDVGTIGYLKNLSDQTDIPYQNLINLYPTEGASKHKKIDPTWK
ncbi:toxin-antitoxin system, antitoxin component, ribbon-helix-helix domain protein [Leptospira weilii serovar Ranarum str. ICFT]|uniref:Toxin-antitoxin system, antitoxin component, ribbon-helix-helix domain protein n=1 Tax=Leptospira weilii serovar Ranarum str. ICFT TaxID=1218598 RepID=N1WR58_9LEPT|nr:toxin-antitoxin system, antitoxin component, ribbon-helix-helix domain protein [Leptospira weilii serovar Ranarum str. ICFT]